MKSQLRYCVYILLSTVLMTTASTALSCTTPVFRYAIERWLPAPFKLTIYHNQELSVSDKKLLGQIKDRYGLNTSTNLKITTQKVKKENESKVLAVNSVQKFPFIAISYPPQESGKSLAWSGKLELNLVKKAIESDTAKQVVEKISSGAPSAWVFLRCGDKTKDDATYALVKKELAKLSPTYKEEKLPKKNADGTPFEFFPLIDTPRTADNAIFIKMLLGIESDLEQLEEPMLFPFYGHGRALFPLIGKGITPEMIKSKTDFLMSECSCIVKDQNPGADLLFKAQWDKFLGDSWIEDEELPPLTGFSDFIVEKDLPDLNDGTDNATVQTTPPVDSTKGKVTDTKSPAEPIIKDAPIAKESTHSLLRNILIVAAFVVVLLIIGSLKVLEKKND